MKFLHTADWQLGMTRHFLGPEAQSRFTDDRIEAIERLGELAAVEGCEFVVVCGDVFESAAVSRTLVRRALEALRVVPMPVYLLPGNHDPLDAASIYHCEEFRRSCPKHVSVLTKPGLHPVREGVEIAAAPWTSKHPSTDLLGAVLSGLEPAPEGTLRIAAGHGAVDWMSPDRADSALITLNIAAAALDRGAVHYIALGDRHSPTALDDRGETSGDSPARIWYSGSQEPTDYDEIDSGSVLAVELAEPTGPVPIAVTNPVVTRHRVGRWSFRDLQHQLDQPADLQVLANQLDALPEKSRTVVRLSLRGSLRLAERARLDELLERQRELFASLRIWERHTDVAVYDDGYELAELGVAGFAADAAAELASQAHGSAAEQDPQRAETARDALCLLYRLAGGGR